MTDEIVACDLITNITAKERSLVELYSSRRPRQGPFYHQSISAKFSRFDNESGKPI